MEMALLQRIKTPFFSKNTLFEAKFHKKTYIFLKKLTV